MLCMTASYNLLKQNRAYRSFCRGTKTLERKHWTTIKREIPMQERSCDQLCFSQSRNPRYKIKISIDQTGNE